MELREPPVQPTASHVDGLSRGLLVVVLLVLLVLGWVLVSRSSHETGSPIDAAGIREVAAKLQAAGALDEATLQYERYLEVGRPDRQVWAGIATSLGNNYLEAGRYESALRWYYEAETMGAGEFNEELAGRIVQTLERLGRSFAAQAALSSRAGLSESAVERPADDPVVARIGEDEIRRSEVERALDDLPPELATELASSAGRSRFLERYVADELLWRKALKLEYDRDPEVLRQHDQLLKQLAVARFAEQEILSQIEIDEADLRNHFEANKGRFTPPPKAGEEASEPTFEKVRSAVERDYRLMKMQSAYQSLVDSELAAQDVELFPEKLKREP